MVCEKRAKLINKCTFMYKGLNIERTAILHKTKLLLRIYRSVVWLASNRANAVCESVECYCSKQMEKALEYLANLLNMKRSTYYDKKRKPLIYLQFACGAIQFHR